MEDLHLLSAARIESLCPGIRLPRLIILDKTHSTNTLAKELARKEAIPEEGIIIAAEEQTAGRGRLGRSFLSDGRGLYFSYLFRPEIPAKDIVRITTYAAVAMARAIDSLADISVGIKWVNDLYLGGKKLAGILTEGSFDTDGELEYAVLGIGINLYNRELPPELCDIATSLEAECGKKLDKSLLLAKFLKEFSRRDILKKEIIEEYKARSVVLGHRILIERANDSFNATAEDIMEDGSLAVILDTGERRRLFTGEVSIRILN